MGKISEVKEFIMNPTSGYLVYDIEADYTLNRIVSFENTDSDMSEYFNETLPISPDIYALEDSNSMYSYTDGTPDLPNQKIQDVTAIELRIDGQSINIPLESTAIRSYAEAITTANGHKVWWPGTSGSGSQYCIGGPCVKVTINLGPNQDTSFEYVWPSVRNRIRGGPMLTGVDPRIPGSTSGIIDQNSSTFDDFENRGSGERVDDFGHSLVTRIVQITPSMQLEQQLLPQYPPLTQICLMATKIHSNLQRLPLTTFERTSSITPTQVLVQPSRTSMPRCWSRWLRWTNQHSWVYFERRYSRLVRVPNPVKPILHQMKHTWGYINCQCRAIGAIKATSNWMVATSKHPLM